jgi:hypothetical protein
LKVGIILKKRLNRLLTVTIILKKRPNRLLKVGIILKKRPNRLLKVAIFLKNGRSGKFQPIVGRIIKPCQQLQAC